jgi:hypothetical protein
MKPLPNVPSPTCGAENVKIIKINTLACSQRAGLGKSARKIRKMSAHARATPDGRKTHDMSHELPTPLTSQAILYKYL